MAKTDSQGEFTLRGIPSPDLRTMTGALISGKLSSLNSLTISVESKDRMIKTVNIKPITQEILNDAREFLILWEGFFGGYKLPVRNAESKKENKD